MVKSRFYHLFDNRFELSNISDSIQGYLVPVACYVKLGILSGVWLHWNTINAKAGLLTRNGAWLLNITQILMTKDIQTHTVQYIHIYIHTYIHTHARTHARRSEVDIREQRRERERGECEGRKAK